jgi:Reverse transcriptase (RNA-dependent DNA polymerase)
VLSTKDGGIRSIAISCTLRRLVAKAACGTVRDRVTERLVPLQLGFGVQQGAEAAVHAARCYIRNLTPGGVLLKIDFTTAFKTINRDEVFSSTADYAAELLPFIDVCYGQPIFLCYGQYVIKSEVGVQQGDPLGLMSYCTSTQKMIQSIKTNYR